MPDSLNPINRVWKPKAPAGAPTRPKFDIYGNDMPQQDAHEKNTDSIWDTYEALQAAAESERLVRLSLK
jgi:hypothetical protein